ncbi:MAG: vitamin K epoxide reductase family protein [bacterium]|nr:vitamin K epoxide reductase family protein [bacterium]
MIESISIFIAAVSGFFISFYVWHKKAKKEKLVCIIGKNCNAVVYSQYAHTFGFPNEVMGMCYYGMVAVSRILMLLHVIPAAYEIDMAFTIITASAAVFSLYLIFIQAFVLKEWCEWCVVSGILSITIFLLVVL